MACVSSGFVLLSQFQTESGQLQSISLLEIHSQIISEYAKYFQGKKGLIYPRVHMEDSLCLEIGPIADNSTVHKHQRMRFEFGH